MQKEVKNRRIPFGYRIVNGKTEISPRESKAVIGIFKAYRAGSSLLAIAESLNEQRIEYLPDITGWNKARVKRIIEDVRYTGKDDYPAIIDRAEYEASVCIKKDRNTQNGTDRKKEIYKLGVKVFCASCGSEMKRQTDTRQRIEQCWNCNGESCGIRVRKADSSLLADVTELMNALIAEPSRVQREANQSEMPLELRRLENEIGRMLDTADFDRKVLVQNMLERASLKYQSIDSKPYIAKRLRADLERSGLLSDFSKELFGRTVKSILLDADGNVSIRLINDQIIGKE
ncbi:MAG: recombinase family protein [Clostridia bacterium]|nr:recombinase family protein [Clostridia bacterium]